MPDPSSNDDSGKEGLAALGIVALAVGCCGGLPLILTLAATVGLGTVLGVGVATLAAVALIALVVVRTRARRRACEPRAPGSPPAVGRRH
jgi:hypothetical protein